MASQPVQKTEIALRDNSSLLRFEQEDENRKAELITGYVEKFAAIAGRAITPQLLGVYFTALKVHDYRKLEKALKRYLERGTKFPWPGELAEMVDEEV